MNSFELIPTEENLIHTLDKDLLKRNKDLVRFYDLILVQEGASSIAIDGRWGSGKTFFVKQSMLLINAKNPMGYFMYQYPKQSLTIEQQIFDKILSLSKEILISKQARDRLLSKLMSGELEVLE